jgi:ligand-binding sensor domain-containing protein
MKKYFPLKSTFTIISILFCITACNGQVKTDLPKDAANKKNTFTNGQAKLIKTQGSNVSDNIHCALQDKAGRLWFGTTGEGIYCYGLSVDKSGKKLFTQFTKQDGLNSNTVWSILEDRDGSIWIGTDAGLCRLSVDKAHEKMITEFSLTNGNNIYPSISQNSNTYFKKDVWSMMQDKNGKIWFGAADGVYCYDGLTFTHFLENDGVINKDSLHLKMVDCIIEDKNGNIWFASGMPPGMEGVCCFDAGLPDGQRKSINSYKPNGDGWIRYMFEDKNEHIWFGGRLHGNFIYDQSSDKLGEKRVSDRKNSFSNFNEKEGIGNAILCDHLGNIWFTGEEANNNYESKDGVWLYKQSVSKASDTRFKNFSTKDGMGKYFVHCMIEDSDGYIWVGTRNTGLYRYDPSAEKVSFVSFSD